MENKDIRWQQRFMNFTKAFLQLEKFVEKGEDLNEMEQQGMIQAFENNFELAWNLMKDFYEFQGVAGIQGSRDVFRLAFNRGLIADGEGWMDMIESRNKTSHTYNEETADEITEAILNRYYFLFQAFHKTMADILGGQANLFNKEK